MISHFSHVQLFATLELWPVWLLCLWGSPGKNTGVGSQRIFLIQESKPCLLGLLHCRQILYHWSTREAPRRSQFSSVQSLSHVRLFAIPWITAPQASLSITNSWSSLKLLCIESVMPSSHLILCHPLLLPPIPPSLRVFSSESTLCMRWPKHWSFSSDAHLFYDNDQIL